MLITTSDRAMLMTALQSKSADAVQARMANALLLLSDGLSVEDVAGLLFLDQSVIRDWQALFTKHAARAA